MTVRPNAKCRTDARHRHNRYLTKVARLLKPASLLSNQVLYRQGDAATSLFWIRGGKVKILRKIDHAVRHRGKAPEYALAEMVLGDIVGGHEVVFGGPRLHTVVSQCDTFLVELSAKDLMGALSHGTKRKQHLGTDVLEGDCRALSAIAHRDKSLAMLTFCTATSACSNFGHCCATAAGPDCSPVPNRL